jgi:NAD(P)H-dependent FMN reductase
MISVISGSIRKGNNSIKLARHIAGLYENLKEEVAVLDLQKLPPETFTEEAYGEKPDSLKTDFIDKVLASDGLVVIVPEYNGSYAGVLKHFIDLLPFPESFDCRPVAFVGLAGGYYGGLRAVEQLQMVFAYRNAHLFNRRVFIPSIYGTLDEDGEITDADLKERLALQAEKFLAFTQAMQGLA